jgi:CHAT domain-containing protein/Tfp pilus assembly protein PilF
MSRIVLIIALSVVFIAFFDFDQKKAIQATIPTYQFDHPVFALADSLFSAGQFDRSIEVLDSAASATSFVKAAEEKINLLTRLGFFQRRLRKWEESKNTLNYSLSLAKEKYVNGHPTIATVYFYMGGLFDRVGRPEEALAYFDSALQVRQSYYGSIHPEVANVYIGLGDVYRFNFSDYDNSSKNYLKALEIQEKTLDSADIQLGTNYYNLASILRLKGEFENALIYARQAIRTFQQSVQTTPNLMANSYMLLGNIYFGLGNYADAAQEYQLAIDISLENPTTQQNLGDFYNSLGAAYRSMDSTVLAKQFYFKAQKEISDRFGASSARLSYVMDNLGLIYKDQGLIDSAFYYFDQSLKIRYAQPNQISSEIAQVLRFKGDIYAALNQYDLAVGFYQQAIDILIGANEMGDPFSATAKESLFEDQELLKAITLKATMLKEHSLSVGDEDLRLKLLVEAHHEFMNSDDILTRNRQSSDLEGTKLFLSEFYRSAYEEALHNAFLLYQYSGADGFLDSAYYFMAKSKGLALLETLSGVEAANSLNLPPGVLEKENTLKSEIAGLKQRITRLRSSGGDNASLSELNSQLLSKIREQELFKAQLEQDYPSYYDFKYRKEYASLRDLKNWSDELEGTIIEIFYGNTRSFVFGVQDQKVNFHYLPIDTLLENKLLDYNNSLKFGYNFSTQQADFQTFIESSKFLYDSLVAPAISGFSKRTNLERLVIIPDGYLSAIPFDAIISELPKSKEIVNYRSLDYLHTSYIISYQFNSTIGSRGRSEGPRKIKNLLAFSFSDEDVKKLDAEQLLRTNQIGGSIDEVNAISDLISNTKLMTGLSASESNFLRYASDYDILHLAIHGEADVENALNSRLIFPGGGNGADGSLYPYELYSLNLKAKLVVLSACESGSGQLFQGEGIFSMARAFAFAGSPSVIMSLWKINDRSTTQLMSQFYRQLSESIPIDESLHLAKRNYLQLSDELTAHPANWAAIVPIGDMASFIIADDKLFVIIGWFLLPLPLGLIIFFVLKRRRISK